MGVFELVEIKISENNAEEGVNAFLVGAEIFHLRAEDQVAKLFQIWKPVKKRKLKTKNTIMGKLVTTNFNLQGWAPIKTKFWLSIRMKWLGSRPGIYKTVISKIFGFCF